MLPDFGAQKYLNPVLTSIECMLNVYPRRPVSSGGWVGPMRKLRSGNLAAVRSSGRSRAAPGRTEKATGRVGIERNAGHTPYGRPPPPLMDPRGDVGSG